MRNQIYEPSNQRGVVALVGATGRVGKQVLNMLITNNIGSDIICYSQNPANVRALIKDMKQGYSSEIIPRLWAGQNSGKEFGDVDVYVHTAGRPRGKNETRRDLVSDNAIILSEWANKLKKSIKRTFPTCIMVTNPVTTLTELMYRITGFSKEKFLGAGPQLDTNRIIAATADFLGVKGIHMSANVWGAHGDEYTVAPLEHMRIKGASVTDFLQAEERNDELSALKTIVEKAKTGSQDIVAQLGGTEYGPASDIVYLIKAALQLYPDEKVVHNAIVPYKGEYGIRDVSMAAPVKLKQGGLDKIIAYPLDGEDFSLLKRAAKVEAETLDIALEAVGMK